MAGFGLLELMIAMGLGLIVTAGVLVIFIAEQQVYNNSSSQSLMQDANNAISATISPVARGVGFLGCGVIDTNTLNDLSGAPTPLTFNTSSAVQGYTGTIPSSFSFVDGAANVTSAGDWNPSLDTSIVNAGGAEQGNDVLVLVGAVPNFQPIGLPNGVTTSPFTVNNVTNLPAMPVPVAVSDCGYSTVFLVTAVNGTSLTYSSGPNGTPQYPVGTQLVPLQQTMFFVAQGHGGQSSLFEGVMTIPAGGSSLSGATWTVNEMVPGVTAMKVLYGIGTGGQATQYVDASQVTNWLSVTSIKLGFVVEGDVGSVAKPSAAQSYTLFNDTNDVVTVPADTRLRHVFYMTINTRNSTL